MDIKRRWKSLSFKVEHLRLELEEKQDLIKQFEKKFLLELSKLEVEDIPYVPPGHDGVTNVNKDDDSLISKNFSFDGTIGDGIVEGKEMPSAEIHVGPEEMKKLWKKIVSVSHPDKTKNDPVKTELYKKAANAWKSKSYDNLCKVAIELGIDLPDASSESIEMLSNISLDLEKKLKSFESSILWLWAAAGPEKKLSIIDLYLRSIGKRRKINK